MVSILWLLVACGGGDKGAATGPVGDDGSLTTTSSETPAEAEAELVFTDPGPAGYTSDGAGSVGGTAVRMTEVTVNGAPAQVADGGFTADVDLLPGIHGIEVEGIDDEGATHVHQGAILAGTFADPTGPSYDAVQVHLGPDALSEVGPLVSAFVTPDLLNPTIQGLNPVVDSSDAVVYLGDVYFDEAIADAVPTDQGLLLTLELPGFVLPIDATVIDALPFGVDLDIGVDVEADLYLDLLVDLDTDGRGNLLVTVKQVQADLGEFDLDTGLLELIDWLFLDDDDLALFLEAQLEQLGPQLGGAIEGALANLDLAMETELLGSQLSLEPAFDAAGVDADGVFMSIAIALEVDAPAPDAPGHLAFAPPPAAIGDDVHLKISDDFMNRALFELWAGGALDLELDLSEGAASALLLLFGGGDEGSLSLDPKLPPVWVERDGQARMQLGEVYLTVETPGGDLGERVELLLNLDAAAEVSFDGTAAGVVLSDAKVDMVAVGDSAGNEDLDVEALEGAFGVGISIINGMLSFPLDGLVPAGTLPELGFERDASGLGTQLELSLADVDVYALLGMPAPPDHEIAVPASATVHEVDTEVTTDLVEGWVCDGAEVTVSGLDGVWYVDAGAELVITGTGHTVYAVADGQVTLDAPSNTVQADPGADVDDNDGTNVITTVDPTTFDLTSAPKPGCP